jgi:ribosome biogenesis GTPase
MTAKEITEKESPLNSIGYSEYLKWNQAKTDLIDLETGRVSREERERYTVSDGISEFEAEITGNMRYSATQSADFPTVGDWVTFKPYNKDQAIIHNILPRKTLLERQDSGHHGRKQLISANIDTAFIMQAINNNFSINRLERYLSICHNSGILPVVIFSKTDLMSREEISGLINQYMRRERTTKHILLSNITAEGLDDINALIERGKTYCVVGSSGVGKSTLINTLLKQSIIKTNSISESTNKGKHTTVNRQLYILENGGIIIDTPGMKELGITDNPEGISITFSDIYEKAKKCRYKDCQHVNEKGCAVKDAVSSGAIDKDSYHNYLRLHREQMRFEVSVTERRRKEKIFSKIVKNYMKSRNNGDKEIY